jgi:hypothetical protein
MFTYKALGLIWLVIFALFAMSGLGSVVDSWVLPLVLAALAAGLIMTLNVGPRVEVAPTTIRQTPVVSYVRDRSPLQAAGIDLYRWDNDGGAAESGFGPKYAASPNPV